MKKSGSKKKSSGANRTVVISGDLKKRKHSMRKIVSRGKQGLLGESSKKLKSGLLPFPSIVNNKEFDFDKDEISVPAGDLNDFNFGNAIESVKKSVMAQLSLRNLRKKVINIEKEKKSPGCNDSLKLDTDRVVKEFVEVMDNGGIVKQGNVEAAKGVGCSSVMDDSVKEMKIDFGPVSDKFGGGVQVNLNNGLENDGVDDLDKVEIEDVDSDEDSSMDGNVENNLNQTEKIEGINGCNYPVKDVNSRMVDGKVEMKGNSSKSGLNVNVVGGSTVLRHEDVGMETQKKVEAGANAWKDAKVSFVELIKKANEEEFAKLDFMAPVRCQDGQTRVVFSKEELKICEEIVSLHLYGYFVGTSMDYQVVSSNLRRMWRAYGLVDISKNASGFFFFKFKDEKGMKEVLENGPWLVENIPLMLNEWEPGVGVQRVEPSKLHIWVCLHQLGLELWNGLCISKLLSYIGIPLLMDKVTKDRCVSKSGRMGYARVLVEVSADKELPNEVEAVFPSVGSKAERIVKFPVSYQWKPPLCVFCKSFGHTTKQCKLRPRTADEVAAQVLKETLKVNVVDKIVVDDNGADEEGFVTVNRKSRGSNLNGLVGNKQSGSFGQKGNGKVFHDKRSVFDRIGSSSRGNINQFRGGQNSFQTKGSLGPVRDRLKKDPVKLGSDKYAVKGDKDHVHVSNEGVKSPRKEYVVVNDKRNQKKEENDKGKQQVGIETSNTFSVLEEQNMDDECMADPEGEDWDTEYLVYGFQKDAVMFYINAKKDPDKKTVDEWTCGQYDFYVAKCLESGMTPVKEDGEVGSDLGETGQFMKVDSDDNGVPVVNEGTSTSLYV